MPFSSVHPALARSLAGRAYTEPTPVQRAVIAPQARGRDLLVSARTGSGKTVAFGLALAETLLGEAERLAPAGAPLALVIAPTRELALQVQREFGWLYGETGARVVSCVGGMDPRQEQRQLAFGAHVVVGTPGRLRDHLERGRLDLSQLQAVVLDEADEMLDLGFREDLETILDATPEERRSLLFSATLPPGIVALARRYQRGALRIEADAGESGHADIAYQALRVRPAETAQAVVNVLRFHDAPSAIVFCNTREAVRRLHASLAERGFAAVALSGEMTQNERNQALQALRDGRARVCVATDVAARGIDLPGLGLVIHAELPSTPESLQHRSGRTGRAGRKGLSVLLTPPHRRRRVADMLRALGVTPEWAAPPAADEIRRRDDERMLQDPAIAGEAGEADLAAGAALLERFSPAHLAAALARLYRAGRPAPEEVTDPGEPPAARGRARGAAGPADPSADGGWFRINVGRRQNADPKWLLPMICRRGDVTRRDIGAIRISDNETVFEVAAPALEHFRAAVRRPDAEGIRFTPLADGPGAAPGARDRGRPVKARPRPPRDGHDGGFPPGEARGEAKTGARGRTARPAAAEATAGRKPRLRAAARAGEPARPRKPQGGSRGGSHGGRPGRAHA
ncbi:DEAD/DEAH box helicase [Camelimonas abortus]|uniref:DEAD/DEAH box helicase n=1 Tax=Camelimonas abortus TaxID=1017184 RepID=A0ABV7LAI6_9HYPH